MKIYTLIPALLALTLILVLAGCEEVPESNDSPIIPEFVADPSAHVFGDQVYIYLTNDEDNSGEYWDSRNWRLFSSSNFSDWENHGIIFSLDQLTWADELAWAPAAVERDGTYYIFLPVERTMMAVASSDSPTGPFTDAIGEPLIDKARDENAGDEPIDPFIYIDDDNQAYLYFGTRVPKVVKLADDMLSLSGPIMDLELDEENYGEAPWVHKHDGLYYFTYSTGWPGQIAYATGPGPMGPFTYQGIVLDYTSISTNHHSVVHFNDNWYIFYHNASLPGGGHQKRSVHVDRLHHNPDGTIQMLEPAGGHAVNDDD